MSNLPDVGGPGYISARASTRAKIPPQMAMSENQAIEELYEFGPFRVDPARETLLKAGVAVPLTPKTFQILLVLVRHGKETVTKDDLMKTVWPDTFVEEANLSRNIFMLRKALGETAQDHRYIVTVPGRQLPACAASTRRFESGRRCKGDRAAASGGALRAGFFPSAVRGALPHL